VWFEPPPPPKNTRVSAHMHGQANMQMNVVVKTVEVLASYAYSAKTVEIKISCVGCRSVPCTIVVVKHVVDK
jgi:hypothetical protein